MKHLLCLAFSESEPQISPWQQGHSGGERNGKHSFSQLSTVKGDGGEDAGREKGAQVREGEHVCVSLWL